MTLLFTDVERATVLSARLGEQYGALHDAHRQIIVEAIRVHGGEIVDAQGETVFGAFLQAGDAVLAAAAAQRSLMGFEWPEGGQFHVRMGLHTGAPAVTDHGLVGIDVHRVARLCTAGHGGQILVSGTARREIVGTLPGGFQLRELGEHQLKDMPEPESISQLVVSGLPSEFPPVRSLGIRSGFPAPRHPVVGRHHDLSVCGALLLDGGVRLLTITGPGGSGKTALALQLAANIRETFPAGAYFVSLAQLTDAALVPENIALALDVRDPGQRAWIDAIQDAIGPRRLLLVLDNFEHLPSAAPVISQLHAACSELVIVVTSRDLLRLPEERGYALPPLALPPPGEHHSAEELLASPAVRLFVERVQDVRPGFLAGPREAPLLAGICRRLDGLPLAIELAAARVRMLPPAALLQRLDRRLPLLTGGARDLPARQQTLRATIAWSYELLSKEEQQLMRLLSVFSGCTPADVLRICRGEEAWTVSEDPEHEVYAGGVCLLPADLRALLTSLADKSLLQRDQRPGAPRYVMLETIREFALEQLRETGEEEFIRTCHLRCFVGLAEEAEVHLFGPEQDVWLDRLGRERENFQAAERWAAASGDVESVIRLSAPLLRFWQSRASAADARERLDAMHKLAPAAPAVASTVKALHLAAIVARLLGDFDSSQALSEQSLAVARQIGHQDGIARGLGDLSKLAGYRGEYDLAKQLGGEGLAILEQTGSLAPLAETLREVGMIHYLTGELTQAGAYFGRALAAGREIGDQRAIANTAFSLALVHHVKGEHAAARLLYDECLATDRAQGNRGSEGSVLNNLGHLTMLEGDLAASRTMFRDSLRASREVGDRRRIAFTLSAVAGLMALEQEPELAVRIDATAKAVLEQMGATLAPAMRCLYDAHLESALSALGEMSTEIARATGRSTRLEHALATALEWLTTGPNTASRNGQPGSTASGEVATPTLG